MTSEIDIYRAANVLVKRFGEGVALEPAIGSQLGYPLQFGLPTGAANTDSSRHIEKEDEMISKMARTSALAIVLLVVGATAAHAESFSINGNGHTGVLTYAHSGDRITGTIYGDPIEGFQIGRHLVFYRVGAGQVWSGWLWGDGHGSKVDAAGTIGAQSMISGTFSHRGEKSFPWHGAQRPE
jgi:hypothetical protein